jgi:adenylate cyclase, class 2
MKTEIEAKFLDINHDELRKRLLSVGAVCEMPLTLMKRAIIDYADRRLQTGASNAYIRVRDEGRKITLTYKQFTSLSVDGAQEVEVVVDSFDDAVNIFTAIGMVVASLQESKREVWSYKNCEIVLDEWPWLNPYIEIEGDSEEDLIRVAEVLGLNWTDAVFGDIMVAYRKQYPHLTKDQTVGKLAEVRFDTPFPEAFM